MPAVRLSDPVRRVAGEKTAKGFTDLGITTVGQLLRHYPRRYFERGEAADLAQLPIGEHVTVQARVLEVKPIKPVRPKLTKTDVVITDGRVKITVTFFNAGWVANRYPPGTEVLIAGVVDEWNNHPRFTHPELHKGDDLDEFAGALVPVYPATRKLPSWNIAKAVATALAQLSRDDDPVPDDIRRARELIGFAAAIEKIHRPDSWGDVTAARHRLRFDEAFFLQLTLAQRRHRAMVTPTTPRAARRGGLVDAFDQRLPFALTAGQREVGATLDDDLAQPRPMHRLLQGEVGSGKTVVALRAMLRTVDAGGQAALLAPTEVLATQHHRTLAELLGPLGRAGELDAADPATALALLTGSTPAARRRAILDGLAAGRIGIVVGTHALLQPDVRFADLGLAVVDEQHRFGVHQRDALREKGAATPVGSTSPPHLLVMTATPIPRTVAMTVFGDLEVSTLTELPRGRSPIQTYVVPADNPAWCERMWARVRREVADAHQAFIVCPRIGEDESDDDGEQDTEGAAAVADVAPRLAAGELAGLRVEALHGRLPSDAKDDIMRRFAAGDIDVLVATTVIEVGVDVPNATAMVVLDADRFGVSALHQLRGRVGRGAGASWCLLHTSAAADTPARQRLDAVAGTLDGFVLSRVDLEQRHEGNVLGAAQAGRSSALRLLRLTKDEDVIVAARESATRLIAADPDLDEHPALRAALQDALDEEQADYLERA